MQAQAAIQPQTSPSRTGYTKLEDVLRGLNQDFDQSTRLTMQAFYRAWAKNELYHRGDQLLDFDEFTGMWETWSEEERELFHVVNYVLPYVEMNAVEYAKSDPKFVAYTTSGDDRELLAAVEQAQYIVDCLKETLWTAEEKQREGHVVQFRGGVLTRTFMDMFRKTRKQRVPRLAPVEQKLGRDMVECADCQWIGHADETGLDAGRAEPVPEGAGASSPDGMPASPSVSSSICPNCGVPGLILRPAPMVSTVTQTGEDLVPAGDVRSPYVDPYEVTIWDRALTVEDSPYLKWERVELKAKVKAEYKHARIPDTDDGWQSWSAVEGMSGLAYKRMLELSAGNSTEANQEMVWSELGLGYGRIGAGGITDRISCRRVTIYYEQYVYADIILDEDYVIEGTDKRVVAGVPLGEQFPDGIKIEYAGEQILDIENWTKNDEWSGYKYIVTGAGFHGMGIQNMLSLNDWANEMNSYQLTAIAYQGNGITVVNGSYLKEGDVDMSPGSTVVVEDLMPGETLDAALVHHKTQGLGAEAVGMQQMMKADMQMISGARSSQTTGMPGPEMDTATGVNYQEATSDAFAGMRLQLKAWNTARRLEQALKLYQKHEIYPVFRTKWGETRGRWFAAAQIGADIKVRVEPNSHQPRTQAAEQQDFLMATKAGYGNPMTPPPLQRRIATLFNQPDISDQYEDWAMIGEKRLMLLRETIEQATAQGLVPEEVMQVIFGLSVPDPMSPTGQMEVIPGMKKILPDPFDNNEALVQFYKIDFWLSDEGQNIDELTDMALHQLVALHENAVVMQMQKAVTQQMAGEAPARDAAREEQEGQEAKEDERSARDADREDERSDKQRAHEREMATIKAKEKKDA